MLDSDKFDLLLEGQQRTTALVSDLIQDLRSVQAINERLALLAHRLAAAEDYLKQLEAFKRDCVTIRKECSALINARIEDMVTKREKRGDELHATQTKCLERSTELMRQLHDKSSAIHERINLVRAELYSKIDHVIAESGREYDCARDKAEVAEKALSDKLTTFSTDAAGKFGKFSGYASILPFVVGLLMVLLQLFVAHSHLVKPLPTP